MIYITAQDLLTAVRSSILLQLISESYSQSDVGGSVVAMQWKGVAASLPGTPAAGDTYFHTQDKKFKVRIANTWVTVLAFDDAEAIALEEAAGYLRTRYDWPAILHNTNVRNARLVSCLADMMLYHLYSRVRPKDVPDLRKERYEAAIVWLNQVNEGIIMPALPVEEPDEDNPNPGMNFRFGGNPKFNSQF